MTLARTVGAVQGNDPHTKCFNRIFRKWTLIAAGTASYLVTTEDDLIGADTTTGVVTDVKLPSTTYGAAVAPEDGDQYDIFDSGGTANVTNITIHFGATLVATIAIAGQGFRCIYNKQKNAWQVFRLTP